MEAEEQVGLRAGKVYDNSNSIQESSKIRKYTFILILRKVYHLKSVKL